MIGLRHVGMPTFNPIERYPWTIGFEVSAYVQSNIWRGGI